jgi:DNA-binding response OmpR family regulator
MNKTILIIEKNIEAFLYYKKILLKEGFKVLHVSSDIELLKYEFTIPDLFIVNSRFLTLTAVEICQHLKNNPLTSMVPVVIVSAVLDIKGGALQAGAAAVIGNPFIVTDFLATIRRCLNF